MMALCPGVLVAMVGLLGLALGVPAAYGQE